MHISSLADDEYKKIVFGLNLEKLNCLKNGGFIFSAHFGNWDIVPRLFLFLNKKITIIYQNSGNHYIDTFIKNERGFIGANLIAKGHAGTKDLIRAIRERDIIIVLLDQRDLQGIEVEFFSKKVMTSKAIARLALQHNMPIVPVCTFRSKDKKSFDAVIEDQLELPNTGDKEQDIYNIMLTINQTIEKWIRKDPAQWMWPCNRWSR